MTRPPMGWNHSVPSLSMTARSCWHRKKLLPKPLIRCHLVTVIEVLHVGIVQDTVSDPSVYLIIFATHSFS